MTLDRTLTTISSASDWSGHISLPHTDPIGISNGALSLHQTAYLSTMAVEDIDGTAYSGTYDGPEVSKPTGRTLDTSGELTVNFTTEYTIPNPNVAVRWGADQEGVATGSDWYFPGEYGGEFESQVCGAGVHKGIDSAYDYGHNIDTTDLSPGTHSVYFDARQCPYTAVDSSLVIDAVAVFDSRYYGNTAIPSTLTANDHLSKPRLYPDSYTVTLGPFDTNRKFVQAQVESTWNNTSGNQITLRGNNSTQTISGSNTSTVTGSFDTTHTQLFVDLELSSCGSRTTGSPTTDYLGHEVRDLTVSVQNPFTLTVDDNPVTEITVNGNEVQDITINGTSVSR